MSVTGDWKNTYPGPRLPFDPINDRLHRLERAIPSRNGTRIARGVSELARHCGVSRRALCRARAQGATLRIAEAAADYFGLHPVELWGDDYIAACDEHERIRQAHVNALRARYAA